MCGITGVYAFNMIGRVSMINIANATEAISSRGPDFQNIYNDQVVALGHRRLSIIDTSPQGHQPLWDNSGRYCIIFNGEIFNYQSLKQQLLTQGVQFHSATDTEVLLQLLIREGIKALDKVNGFFSFAFYDLEKADLLIARDRLGIKPLYYLYDHDRLIFASEMKSLIEYGIEKNIDYAALKTYLHLNYIPAPKTILQGVRKLLPGEYLSIKNGEFQQGFYYQLKEKIRPNKDSYEQQKAQLHTLMANAVEKRLVADVPLGSFLSGGLDSSIIAALAAQRKPDLHTFSIGYKDEKFFDETAYAREVAKKIGTEHTVFSLTNKDLYAHVNDILQYIDEPFADSSAIAVYILSKETRKHATVALSGDGADELFAGYNKHAAFYRILHGGLKESLVKTLSPLWNIMPQSRSNKLTNTFRQLSRFGKGAKLSSKERYWQWAGFASEKQILRLLSNRVKSQLDQQEYESFKSELLKYIPAKETMQDLLFTDTLMVLPDDMLTKVDRMSMANSLEVRVPFLDHEVVEFAFSLDESAKITGSTRKRILRETFSDLLPESIYNRPKKGFEVPLLQWFRAEMRSMIEHDLLDDTFIQNQGIFDLKEIKVLKKKLFSSNPGDVHARIWGLIVFQTWWKKHFN